MGPAAQSLVVEPLGSAVSHARTPSTTSGAPKMARWKHEAVKRAIVRAVIASGVRGATVQDISDAASTYINEADLARLGALSLHVAAVLNALEGSGELVRLEGSEPARFVRAWSDVAA